MESRINAVGDGRPLPERSTRVDGFCQSGMLSCSREHVGADSVRCIVPTKIIRARARGPPELWLAFVH